jgi:hypothetical protein
MKIPASYRTLKTRAVLHIFAQNISRLANTIFGTVSAVFLKIQVFCDVTLCVEGGGGLPTFRKNVVFSS